MARPIAPSRTRARRLRVLDAAVEVAGGCGQLVGERDEPVHGVSDLERERRPARRGGVAQQPGHVEVLLGERAEVAGDPRDPADVELGLPDVVEQVVHPGCRDADGVAAAPRALQVGLRRLHRAGQHRHGDRVVAGERRVQRRDHGLEQLGGHRGVGAGSAREMASEETSSRSTRSLRSISRPSASEPSTSSAGGGHR
jgi:hypothetical protein